MVQAAAPASNGIHVLLTSQCPLAIIVNSALYGYSVKSLYLPEHEEHDIPNLSDGEDHRRTDTSLQSSTRRYPPSMLAQSEKLQSQLGTHAHAAHRG